MISGLWDWIKDTGGDALDFTKEKGGKLNDFLATPMGQTIGTGILGLGLNVAKNKGIGEADVKPTGYQGGIPDMVYNREMLNIPNDPNRRPGEAGRRYFTDGQFTTNGAAQGIQSLSPKSQESQFFDASPVPGDGVPASFLDFYRDQGGPFFPVAGGGGMMTPDIPPNKADQAAEIANLLNGRGDGMATHDMGMRETMARQERARQRENLRSQPSQPRQFAGVAPPQSSNRVAGGGGGGLSNNAQLSQFATGGIAQLPMRGYAEGGEIGQYLRGETDGMSDEILTTIDGQQPAALSHGEFVIPADIVSHLGNGNSDAGAKMLEQMMSRVRKERTGNSKQGKEIEANQFLPQ